MKSLVIAEKPSVAADLAKALGKVPKQGDIYENDTWVITSAVGHLVELCMPEDIDKKKYGFWRLETLPIIPDKFELKPIEGSKDRFSLLKKQLARKDIDQVINACDAGREGELIFSYIYQHAKAKVPVKRAWMQTMTPEGIRQAFNKLRDGEQLEGLAQAARCRSESDWLIGINGTRAVTKRMFGSRAGNVASVGRVQTPTLAIVVARELEIRSFVPKTYWRITAQFQVQAGAYEGVYQRANFHKTEDGDKAERVWKKEEAESVMRALAKLHETGARNLVPVSEEKKATTQIAPRLYDLTTLQREANSRFGLSAKRTLQIAQALYEKHKMITYPRTDSRALPEDYIPTCKEVLANLHHTLGSHANRVLENGWVRPNKRIFNNAQISDHFAIIPTVSEHKHLDEMEAKVYDMIARRFVAAFHPPAEIDVTTRTTLVDDFSFKTEGKVITFAGWKAVYGKQVEAEGEEGQNSSPALPPLSPQDGNPAQAKNLESELHQEATKPPARYTEATLLSAMEGAGKLLDDEELAEAMKERGLGTPATRADTIDGLISQKYMERMQKELVPTPKAEQLLQFLVAVKADQLTSPAMTGEWEYKLRQMEQGKVTRAHFMEEIVEQTKGFVDRVKHFEEDDSIQGDCDWNSPTDGKPMQETLRGYKSQDNQLMIYKVIGGRRIEASEARELAEKGEVGPLDGFVSARSGKRYPAKLVIRPDEKSGKQKVEIDLGNKIDLSELEAFWTAPKGKAELCEAANAYILRERKGEEWEEAFKVGRLICQKAITRENAVELVEKGKTSLIEGFISRFGKPFEAYLVKQGGRTSFEFPPRKPREGKDGKAPRKAKEAVDLSQAVEFGKSKAHAGASIVETEENYFVHKPGADDKPRIVFKIKRELCGRKLTREEILQLMEEGRTPLIEDFLSKRGTKFSAALVLSKTKAKADFEFGPR